MLAAAASTSQQPGKAFGREAFRAEGLRGLAAPVQEEEAGETTAELDRAGDDGTARGARSCHGNEDDAGERAAAPAGETAGALTPEEVLGAAPARPAHAPTAMA